jgi:F0F1-type ATP synthase delta subunit
MAQAQLTLGLEQNYAQKLLQLAEDKSKCKIWTRSKYDVHFRKSMNILLTDIVRVSF